MQIVDAVDAALGTDAVRALDRRQAHQVDVDAQLGQLHGGRQAGQSAADDNHALLCHAEIAPQFPLRRLHKSRPCSNAATMFRCSIDNLPVAQFVGTAAFGFQ